MPGFVDDPFQFMAAAAVFVLSSRFEGLPNVLIQAMACGCPVVSTDCRSGPAEILEGGRFGRLTPVEDPPALAAAIEQTLDAPPDAAELKHGASRYRADAIARQYLAFFRDA